MANRQLRSRTETFPLCLEAPQPASLLAPMRLGTRASVGPDPQRQSATRRRVPSPSGGTRRTRFRDCLKQAEDGQTLAAAAQLLLAEGLEGEAVVEDGGRLAAEKHDDVVAAGVDLL